jgi:cysteine-rich repeat protein
MPGATPNTANCNFVVGQVTDVDAYPGSPSPYGTFDQGGNIFEWNDQIAPPSSLWVAPRERRGGSFNLDASTLASSRLLWLSASIEISDIGFRVATLAPDPVCGDGVVEGSERCDDGNTLNGDGCSSSCQVESGWTCNADSPTNCTTSLRDQGNTILDTSNNLEWLKFSQTEGESYNQVVAGFLTANPGWAYATVAQVCTLTTDPQACAANPGTSYKPRGGAVALLTSGSTALQAITGLSNPDGSQGVGLLTTQVNETFLTPSSTEMTLGASQPGVASFLVLQVQGCGIGPELGMVAPLLIWLRARRRRFPE